MVDLFSDPTDEDLVDVEIEDDQPLLTEEELVEDEVEYWLAEAEPELHRRSTVRDAEWWVE